MKNRYCLFVIVTLVMIVQIGCGKSDENNKQSEISTFQENEDLNTTGETVENTKLIVNSGQNEDKVETEANGEHILKQKLKDSISPNSLIKEEVDKSKDVSNGGKTNKDIDKEGTEILQTNEYEILLLGKNTARTIRSCLKRYVQ